MLTTQDYSFSQFRQVFGAGDKYVVLLFKCAAFRQQPACVSYHHRTKDRHPESREPLTLIPGRLVTLCPLIATGVFHLLQHGRSYANLGPPGWDGEQQQAVDWPAMVSAVNAPKAVKQARTEPLQEAAAELGMRIEGGLLSTLRQVNVMTTSANVDCTEGEGARIAEHNRDGRRGKNYYVMHARATQLICHYPNDSRRGK